MKNFFPGELAVETTGDYPTYNLGYNLLTKWDDPPSRICKSGRSCSQERHGIVGLSTVNECYVFFCEFPVTSACSALRDDVQICTVTCPIQQNCGW